MDYIIFPENKQKNNAPRNGTAADIEITPDRSTTHFDRQGLFL